MDKVTNIVVAGLGGQGVITASDILAEAAFHAGFDVKKSEIHGMSQRGGSVSSDVRYGAKVFSPMVPEGEADYLVALDLSQVEYNRPVLKPQGILISPEIFFDEEQGITDLDDLDAEESIPVSKRTINTAILGVLSAYLDIPQVSWEYAMTAHLRPAYLASNTEAFLYGRQRGEILRS